MNNAAGRVGVCVHSEEYVPNHEGHPRNKSARGVACGLWMLVDFWRMARALCSVSWLWSCLAWGHAVIYSQKAFPGPGIPFVAGTWLREEKGHGRGRVGLLNSHSRAHLMSVMLSLMGFNHYAYLLPCHQKGILHASVFNAVCPVTV